MISRDEALSLISTPKHSTTRHIDLSNQKTLLVLHAEDDESLKFHLHITRSKKIEIKLTCHHAHEHIGLIRVDFYGGHKNPESITEDVPDFLHKYIGKRFTLQDHHIHVYVTGFGLDWAVPICEHNFNTKDILNQGNMVSAIEYFTDSINLKTKLMYKMSLI